MSLTGTDNHLLARRLAQVGGFASLPAIAIEEFAGRALLRRFAARDWLLRGGERAEWCFAVTSGLVRELYVGEDGQEHTRSFLAEGELTGSLLDLLSGEPSVTWIQALEPTETIAWRYGDLVALEARFPELQQFARRHAESLYIRKARREHDMLALPAAQRYAGWCRQYPALDRRVSRRDLASYLGITPEHLSRLRRQR